MVRSGFIPGKAQVVDTIKRKLEFEAKQIFVMLPKKSFRESFGARCAITTDVSENNRVDEKRHPLFDVR